MFFPSVKQILKSIASRRFTAESELTVYRLMLPPPPQALE